jgi:RNA polymerase sigma factor (sigma-70 family)
MDSDIESLIERAARGDEQAAIEIWNDYYDRLVRYARSKMRGMPRRDVDEEDVVLSAMNSFFGGARDGRLAPQDAGELWKLLATLTVRKATAQLRRRHTLKRGRGEIRGESAFDAEQVGSPPPPPLDWDHFAPRLGIACEELLAGLENDQLRQIALLRLAGYSNAEIAARVGCSVATVKRRVEQIRQSWSD